MENIETLLAAVAQTTGFGDEEPLASTPSELGLGNSAVARDDGFSGDVRPVGGVVADLTAAVPVRGRVNGGVEKRKRGRPPKGQVVVKPPPIKRVKVEEEEEDVCFICFDGGSLVLCDRKGCPKAYHPACIKRDEAFFNTKAKWNCGWHICSVCRKSSHYLCYTCTYSLCKGCTKDADYVAVRGNNGFCSTCMKTIMLIENKGQANNESIQVDFDDKLSWEYLFKMYWVLLKEKLSLTMTELTQAKSPWKGVAAVTRKPRLNYMRGEVSISCKTEHLELNNPHVECNSTQIDGLVKPLSSNGNHVDMIIKNTADKPVLKDSIHESCIKKDLNDPCIDEDTKKTVNTTDWASNDLLEFVKHMKNGDASALSLFDVQILLVDYVKRNNLWDADQKSQIVCDQTLKKLFGRPRVDYVETLKLLESHFLAKEGSSKDSFVPAGVVKSNACESSVKEGSNSRKRKTRRKNEDRAAQFGSNKYAAIDAHNVNLIYLRRNLVETLLEYHDNFDDKVIGSIVRIRISADDQKPEVHRLVQVTGTSKAAEPYKIGNRTADVMLEVLNLDRKEVVSIVAISNEEFTEDECKWLRQSIRCGLVKQFTVDEVKKKAMALQSVRVNDWLEAEILRLNHLRDQAGEKGIKKELGECVDRLQLLKSPEERQHRISEVPEIHSDPKMNPNYESDEDTRSGNLAKKDRYARPSYSSLPRNDWEPLPSNEKGKEERSIEAQAPIKEKTDASGSNDSEKCTNHIDIATSPAVIASTENSAPADNIETEKLWHYRDPNSKIQGPFSMMQLRKRSTTGLFPPDMRIWTNHEQYDSLLLLDALNGKFHGAPECSHKSASQENGPITSEGESGSSRDSKPTEVVEPVKANEASSGWPRCWDLLKDGSPSGDGVKVRNLLPSSNSETRDEALTDRVGKRDEVNQDGENSSTGTIPNPINEVQNQPNDEVRAGQSLNIDLSSNGLESMPVLEPSSTKPTENIDVLDLLSPTAKTEIPQPVPVDIPVQNTGFLELLSPAPRSNNEDPGAQETDTKQSGFVNLPISNPGWVGPSSQPIWGDVTDEWCAKWDSGENTNTPATDAPTSIPASNGPNWLAIMNEPIEFVALGEDSVSDLLAEVDAMESLGASLPSPTAAIKFAREFLEDCKDDCFSSIEDFGSTPEPRKSDAFSSTSDVNLTSQSSAPCNKLTGASPVDAFDFFRRSTANSSASSEGETSAAVHSGDAGSEFHPPGPQAANQVMVGSGSGPDPTDPGWGQQMQGNNINMVTVQGNVNLVLGGPTQGMANLGWGANPGPGWANPSSNRSPRSGSLPWDGQRKYGGERFNCPREWGYQGGRPPWGRPPYGGGGGGYSRPIPKGQRVCKFYESGHCKKGAHCDYLHP